MEENLLTLQRVLYHTYFKSFSGENYKQMKHLVYFLVKVTFQNIILW